MSVTRFILPGLPFILISLCSRCGSHNQTQPANAVANDTLSLQPDTLCFEQIIGRDSVRLQLFTKGTRVTGNLITRPYEKDRAQGPLIGIRTGDEITADWQRAGEGVTRLYVVDLAIAADTVFWRDGARVEKSGKWELKIQPEGIRYKLVRTNCR